jgi:cytosine/creatinine deaminase
VPEVPSLTGDPSLDAGFEAAYQEARAGLEVGGIPIGSSLMIDGLVVASGHNERVQRGDPIAHGEISCLRNAGRRRDYGSATICSTLAPCDMCTGAILLFGIPHVIVGEDQTFPGSLDYLRARGVRVTVLEDQRCVDLMREFQERWPAVWAEDIGQ